MQGFPSSIRSFILCNACATPSKKKKNVDPPAKNSFFLKKRKKERRKKMVFVLLSALVQRFIVSRVRDIFDFLNYMRFFGGFLDFFKDFWIIYFFWNFLIFGFFLSKLLGLRLNVLEVTTEH